MGHFGPFVQIWQKLNVTYVRDLKKKPPDLLKFPLVFSNFLLKNSTSGDLDFSTPGHTVR
jgi:hypothetical protein